MDEPFEFNDEVMPIELDTSLDWAQGQTFTVSGWGSTFVRTKKSSKNSNLKFSGLKYLFSPEDLSWKNYTKLTFPSSPLMIATQVTTETDILSPME